MQTLTDQIMAEIGPIITSNLGGDTASITIDENTSDVTTVTALDRYSLNNGTETLTYSIVGGADMGLFQIDEITGALTFNAPPDYEAPVGGDNIYDVVVQVNDGATLLDTQEIQVTVADQNDTAPVITSVNAVTVDENTTAVMTVTSDDPDTVGSASYSIVGGADETAFTINASTGELAFSHAPDFEIPGDAGGDNVYDVTVQVSDGIQTGTQDIAVTVADVNEAPNFVDMLAVDGDQTFQATAGVDHFVYDMDATSRALNTYDVDTFTIEGFDATQDKLIFINADAQTDYNWTSERGHIEGDTYYYDRNGSRTRYDNYEEIFITEGTSIDVLDRTRVNTNNILSLDRIDLVSDLGAPITPDAFAYPDNTTSPDELASSVLIYMEDPFAIV